MKLVFLDRDGVINANRPDHVKAWDEFVFLPGVLDALRQLHEARWRVVVVTNQAAVNRCLITTDTLNQLHHRMCQVVTRHGGHIHGVFYCPHRSEEECDCRKPKPGLLLKAATHFGVRLDECYLVGDALSDIMAGYAVGATCILVQTGRGVGQPLGDPKLCGRYSIASDLRAAVQRVFRLEQKRLHPPLPPQPAAPLVVSQPAAHH